MGYSWWWYALERLVGVNANAVMRMLSGDRRRWVYPMTTPAGVQVLRIIGRTDAGQAVVAVVRQLDGRDWEIVRAGEVTGPLLEAFENWESQQ